MAGVIDSEFHANDGFELPPNSRYAPIKDFIATWASDEAKPFEKGYSSHEFAKALVKDVISSKQQPSLYKGPHAGPSKLITNWLPTSLVDFFMSYGQGLKELSQKVAKDNGK